MTFIYIVNFELKYHKDMFTVFRYLHEDHNQIVYTNQLDRALDAIIKVYDEIMEKAHWEKMEWRSVP